MSSAKCCQLYFIQHGFSQHLCASCVSAGIKSSSLNLVLVILVGYYLRVSCLPHHEPQAPWSVELNRPLTTKIPKGLKTITNINRECVTSAYTLQWWIIFIHAWTLVVVHYDWKLLLLKAMQWIIHLPLSGRTLYAFGMGHVDAVALMFYCVVCTEDLVFI